MTATRPAPNSTDSPHEPGITYAYIIARRAVKNAKGLTYDQWRAECSCGRRTDWFDSSNTARDFGRTHHQKPRDARVAS